MDNKRRKQREMELKSELQWYKDALNRINMNGDCTIKIPLSAKDRNGRIRECEKYIKLLKEEIENVKDKRYHQI